MLLDRQEPTLRVTVVTTFYWPGMTGSSQVMTELCEFLAHKKIDTTVVTALPFYPAWRIQKEYRRRRATPERRNGVRILRSWHFVRPNPGILVRLAHEITLAATSIPRLLIALRRCDRCVVLIPSLSLAFVAAMTARFCRVPVTTIVHDIMPDTAIELGMLRNPWVIRFSRWLARSIYAVSEEIHTLGVGMKARIQAVASRKHIHIVPITIDADEMAPPAKERNEFLKTFAHARFTIIHTGNMGEKQDLDILLNAAATVRDDPTVAFLVFGDGAAKEGFARKRYERHLSNVELHELQPRRLLPHMLSGADIVLVSQKSEVVDIAVPSKMITAMAAGAMIVAACDPASEAAIILRDHGAGLVVAAGDHDALVRVIQDLRSRRVDSTGYRAAARSTAMKLFDRNAVYGRMLSRWFGPPVLSTS